jgi:hypothetical protein
MLINGIVNVKVQNSQVKKWETEWKLYQRLVKWKLEEFDPKVEKFKSEKTDDYNFDVVRKQTTQRLVRFKSKNRGFIEAMNSAGNQNESHISHRASLLAEKRNRMRKVDTMLIFDPKVHMNLNQEELDKLHNIGEYEKIKWFMDV